MLEESVFLAALDITTPEERAVYLNRACAGDAALRRQVEALLAAHERVGEFLRVPALQQIAGGKAGERPPRDETMSEQPTAADDADLSFLQPPTKPGSLGRLGHYEVQEVVGRGGCGIVLKAFDEMLHRTVAIKVMMPELAATSPARKRFLREARAAAAIRHENIVVIHAVEDQPIPFLVMEYIAGPTLQQQLDQTGPLDAREVTRIGHQVARGLAAAHAAGLVHRDIKPANVLLQSGGGPVKITDFGLARTADDASVTQSGVIVGTPLYMSPEQAQGGELGPLSDLFSLGSVLYALCSGRPPFRAPTTLAVLRRVVEDEPRPIREIIPEVPDWLGQLIVRLHAKRPTDRVASAKEVVDIFGHYLAERPRRETAEPPAVDESLKPSLSLTPTELISIESSPGSTPTTARRPPRRHRWAAAAVVLVAVFAGLGLAEAAGVTNVRGTVVRLFSADGTLVVEVDDPGVSVSVEGEEVVITGTGAKEIRLKPGQYKVLASKDGKLVRHELVTVSQNGRQVVRVSRETGPGAVEEKRAEIDPDRRAAVWVQSVGGRLKIAAGDVVTDVGPKDRLPDSPFQIVGLGVDNIPTIRDADLAPLQALTHLRYLSVGDFWGNKNLTDRAVDSLLGSKDLVDLHVWGTQITDSGLERLTALKQLRTLNLGRTKITDAGTVHLAVFTKLQDLKLVDTAITTTGFARLRGLTELRYLSLEGTKATDADLRLLQGMDHLQTLDLNGTKIDGTGLGHLKELPALEGLSIYHTNVTDAALASLNGWPHLKWIGLGGTQVSDVGIKHLTEVKGLVFLDVERTNVTAEGLKAFTDALPRCQIKWDGVKTK